MTGIFKKLEIYPEILCSVGAVVTPLPDVEWTLNKHSALAAHYLLIWQDVDTIMGAARKSLLTN